MLEVAVRILTAVVLDEVIDYVRAEGIKQRRVAPVRHLISRANAWEFLDQRRDHGALAVAELATFCRRQIEL